MSQTALVTGASGGIGYELAKLFAHDHHNLILVARSGSKLAQFADELQRQFGVSVKAIPLDLAAPPAPQFLFDQLQREDVAVDILVNNAAYGKFGEFADIPLEETLGQIQLNVTALTCLTKLFLAPVIERHAGKIMNVASTAGFQPGPLMAVYYATKAYVISFSEALAEELRGSGVSVTVLCPGPTRTEFQAVAGMQAARLFRLPGVMDAGDVARAGYRGLMRGKRMVVPGLMNRALPFVVRISPRGVVARVSRFLQEKVRG